MHVSVNLPNVCLCVCGGKNLRGYKVIPSGIHLASVWRSQDSSLGEDIQFFLGVGEYTN